MESSPQRTMTAKVVIDSIPFGWSCRTMGSPGLKECRARSLLRPGKSARHCQKRNDSATPDMPDETPFPGKSGSRQNQTSPRLRRQGLREREGSWMTDRGRVRFGRRASTDLAERRSRLIDQKLDDVARPVRPECAQAPEKGLAGKRRLRPQRESA